MYDVLVEGDSIEEAIQHTEAGDIVAGDPQLTNIDEKLSQQEKADLLKKSMEKILDKYDFIIIDTPPSLGTLLTNALTAAHSCIIPVTPQHLSYSGLTILKMAVEHVRRDNNSNIQIDGVLLVRSGCSEKQTETALKELPGICKDLGTSLFESHVRESDDVKESHRRGASLIITAEDSGAAQDYMAFIDKYLETNI